MQATTLGLVVSGGVAAAVGAAGLMEHRPGAGVVLLWIGIAATMVVCVVLVTSQ